MKVEITEGWNGKTVAQKECAVWEETKAFIEEHINGSTKRPYWRYCRTLTPGETIVDVGSYTLFVRVSDTVFESQNDPPNVGYNREEFEASLPKKNGWDDVEDVEEYIAAMRGVKDERDELHN